MALRATMSRIAAPLRRTAAMARFPAAPSIARPNLLGSSVLQRSSLATLTGQTVYKTETRALITALQARGREMPVAACLSAAAGERRGISNWRLRPYAAAGTQAVLPLSSLSAGFSKVGLSLLVLPWKALPMALALAPTVWLLPAAYRMIFQNSMRHTTASVFTVILYLVLSFMPMPCFENLFSELTFYGIALVSTFFMYSFFPEVLLHDFMFMHYLALFTIPLIPLAFAYMPMFAARSYLFL